GGALDLVRAAQRRRTASVLELCRLDDGAVAQLAAGCLGIDPDQVPAPVLDRLRRDADGVPFYVEELLAEMIGDGSLVRGDDGWTLAGAPRPRVPVTVLQSLTTRADRLGPD